MSVRKVKFRYIDEEEKIPIKFSIDTLNAILVYTISEGQHVTRGNLSNVRKLFRMLDLRLYENDYQLESRVKFIFKALDAKLDNYMENPKLILESCRSNRYSDIEDDIIQDALSMKLKANEIKYITSTIADKLQYAFIYKHKDEMATLLTQLETGDYDSLKKINKAFKKSITALLNDIRKAEALEASDTIFSLNEDIFETMITKTVEKLNSPSNILQTGMQKLNEILSGGFESQRIYLFLGLSGGFKSGLLLNIAYNIKRYNKKYKAKDPTKRPAVFILTQENSVEETIERLFSLAMTDKNMSLSLKDYTPREAMKILKKNGLTLSTDNNIDLVIMYKPGKTINTGDIYDIIDDLEESGYEIICLIHDYIKRLKSVERTSELRLELGYVVDELKTLAINKDIPVISASQLNRAAAATVDEAVEYNKTDLARLLGKANVGESWNMMENADWACIINKEMKQATGQWYLSFKRIKIRFKPLTELTYFNHPFDENNTMRLIPDIDGESVSEVSFTNDFDVNTEANKHGRKNAKKRDTLSFTTEDSDGLTPDRLADLLGIKD